MGLFDKETKLESLLGAERAHGKVSSMQIDLP
jgi:hypothetical protein